jgi:hypothetical protein
MSVPHEWPVPSWLESLPEEERSKALSMFYVRLAALYASEDGQLKVLSQRIGWSESAVSKAVFARQVSPKMAVEIEKTLGRNLFPRELLRPDIFQIEE